MVEAEKSSEPESELFVVYPQSVASAVAPMHQLSAIFLMVAAGFVYFGQWAGSGIFLGLAAIVFVERLLTTKSVAAGTPALVIASEGISGLHAYRQRNFLWEELESIHVSRGNLIIARKPKSLLERWTQLYAPVGSRYRYEVAVVLPLASIEADAAQVESMVKRFAPSDSKFSQHEWQLREFDFFAFEIERKSSAKAF